MKKYLKNLILIVGISSFNAPANADPVTVAAIGAGTALVKIAVEHKCRTVWRMKKVLFMKTKVPEIHCK